MGVNLRSCFYINTHLKGTDCRQKMFDGTRHHMEVFISAELLCVQGSALFLL